MEPLLSQLSEEFVCLSLGGSAANYPQHSQITGVLAKHTQCLTFSIFALWSFPRRSTSTCRTFHQSVELALLRISCRVRFDHGADSVLKPASLQSEG
ncbi:unnamed protein product [Arctogadus glacialis]